MNFAPSESTKENQRCALLDYIKHHGKASTIEIRDVIGISHPAARVMELRRQGFQIETHRVLELDSSGRFHGVALYVYKGGAA